MASDDATRFVAYVTERSEETAARAALRSGLGRTVDQATRLHAYIAPWTKSRQPHKEAVYYTIAALVAHTPEGAIPSESPGNIGASLARCSKLVIATREASMHLLARQPQAQLCRVLTRVVIQIRTADVAVDFAQLLDDASTWPWRQRQIARAWLQSFYRTLTPLDNEQAP